MSLERDTTRIVRSWLENGSTALPDRVLDAVLSELPSTPQQRLPWSPRRTTTMTIRIAAVAAILLIAIVGIALIGVAGRPRPAPTPIPVTGSVTTLDHSVRSQLRIDATATGATASGTVLIDALKTTPLFSIELECVRRVDADTWLFGGHASQTTPNGPSLGDPVAFIVRQGAQPKAGGWFEDEPHAADCPSFLAKIDFAEIKEPSWMWDVVGGDLTIPAGVGA